MAKLRRTLLIGLGGTGISAILNAKKMFYENYGEIPPMIGFLGVDTDGPGFENASVTAIDGMRITLNRSEQLPICVSSPRDIYERNLNSELFDWMPEPNVSGLDLLSIGAGQMRSNGRFAVTVNENNIEQIVNQKLGQINNARITDNSRYGLLGSETEVHIVFSLGGGTGSGTFLNFAYLLKRLLPNVKISGYAVLCDVFRSMVAGAMSARVRANGKGALIDLDYLAHLDSNSEPVEIKWFNRTDRFKERPFSALYLVDNRNENNDTFDNVTPICQMISLAIVTSVGELGVALDSVSDNVNKLISDGAMDVKNKKAWVAGFGCAELVFDGDRPAEIYADKACIQLVNMLLNGGCDDPAIIANNWFDNTQIRENLGKDDVIDYFMTPTPQYTLQGLDSPDNPKPECDDYIANRAMEKPAALNEKLAQLQNKVDESLSNLMNEQANRECGIFLCNQILHNILKQIELCDGEMKEEKERLEDELPRRESGLDTACKELADCMDSFFKRGRRDFEEEVINQTMALAVMKREIERRKMARQFYNWLRVRVGQSIERVDTIMRNLEAVRSQCNDHIQQILRRNGGSSFFQFDLTATYAENVSCPLSDIVFNNFVLRMKPDGGVGAIASMTSQQTAECMLRYTRSMDKVKKYKAMTIDDALDAMSETGLTELLSRAIQKSLPLLPYTYRGFNADLREYPVESYYIGIANKATSRLVKNSLFQNLVAGAKNVQFSEIGLKNRIIIYRQLGVIPTFTIRALDNYASEYDNWENDKPHGSHWDKALCERMARERFNLMPRNEVVEEQLLELWIQAIIYDLISYNHLTKQYQIKSRGMGGKALKGWLVDMGESRMDAFRYLEDNIDILRPEIQAELNRLDVPGPDNIIKQNARKALDACNDNTYLTAVSKCPISLDNIEHYPDEMNLIEKEMEYIIDNL